MKSLAALMGLLVVGIMITAPILSQSVVTSNDTLITGQQTVTSTATSLGAASTGGIKTLCVVAAHGNAAAVEVGGSNVTTSNGLILNADQSICINIKNLNAVFVVGTSGSVSWEATK